MKRRAPPSNWPKARALGTWDSSSAASVLAVGAGPQYTPKLKKRTALLQKLKGVFRRFRSQPVSSRTPTASISRACKKPLMKHWAVLGDSLARNADTIWETQHPC